MHIQPGIDRSRLWPYLLIGAVLLAIFLALAVAGLDLGYTGDLLDIEYHYDRLGFRGGMQWEVNLMQRHLLVYPITAITYKLFPGQSASWYATSLFFHFITGMVFFLFVDTLQRGRRPWLSFGAALIFTFHTHQANMHYELAMGALIKIALSLSVGGRRVRP